MDRVKYPRTRHLPNSPGSDEDDIHLSDLSALAAGEVVLTEKMDGENTTIGPGYVHARSVDSAAHPSRTWVRALAGRLRHEIPEGMRVCGENLYARHSIGYDRLRRTSWCSTSGRTTCAWTGTAPRNGPACSACRACRCCTGGFPGPEGLWRHWSAARDPRTSEGFVVRTAGSFDRDEFGTHLAKWVRPRHVQTDQHWMTAEVVPNQLER